MRLMADIPASEPPSSRAACRPPQVRRPTPDSRRPRRLPRSPPGVGGPPGGRPRSCRGRGRLRRLPAPRGPQGDGASARHAADLGPNVGTQTFLLIGSTSRCVLNNKQTAAFGSSAQGVTGVNSDVILLLRADQRAHSVSVLSIPRDLAMNNARPGEFHKIDAALADGPGQLVAAIEQNFGIPINHFVELNFDTFQNIVNALGGIRMYFPYRVRDDSSGLHIRTTGCVYLNGFNALALVRARNYWYFKDGQWRDDGSGDLGRIIRVHEFLRVLATAVARRGISNPLTDNSLLSAVAPNLEIDSRLSLGDMVDLLRAFHTTKSPRCPSDLAEHRELRRLHLRGLRLRIGRAAHLSSGPAGH